MTRRILIAMCLSLLLVAGAAAQEKGSVVTVNYNGAFSSGTIGNGIDQSTTNSGAFLGSYEYSFSRRQAVGVNYGYTSATQNYGSFTDFSSIKSGMHELTGSYFLKFPIGKLTPFVQAGAGALVFNPSNTSFVNSGTPDTQTKPVFVYGGGADYKLLKNVALRMQYRGLVYKTPDFGLSELDTGTTSHRAEPSVGLVFHF